MNTLHSCRGSQIKLGHAVSEHVMASQHHNYTNFVYHPFTSLLYIYYALKTLLIAIVSYILYSVAL